jgi:hypothetical protein
MSYAKQQDIPEDDCSICYETLKDPTKAVFRLPCGHFFHNDCLVPFCKHAEEDENSYPNGQDYPNMECPLCRQEFDVNECNTFWAFKEGALKIDSLPAEVQAIYLTAHPEQEHQGGRRKTKRRTSKRRHPSKKYTKRRKNRTPHRMRRS